MAMEAVSYCPNSHFTIIPYFTAAYYMCHFIYTMELYKVNTTYLVTPDFFYECNLKAQEVQFL